LAGIFGLQIIIVVLLFLFSGANSGKFEAKSLFSFSRDYLDKVIISDEQERVVIEKSAGKWTLPALNNLPANPNKIDTLVDRLLGLRTNWPVATTSSSHQRFEVADNAFRRKVALFANDKSLGTLFVGTSPGFKKSHLRINSDYAVFVLELNAYDTPVTSNDWLDETLIAAKAITRIKGNGFELTKNHENWQLNDAVKGEQVNPDQAKELSKAFATVQVMGVADNAPAIQGDTVVTLEIEGNGAPLRYQFLESEGKYYVNRSDIESVFMINQYEFERLTKPNRALLTLSEQVENIGEVSSTDS
jgi:hypothetical protein